MAISEYLPDQYFQSIKHFLKMLGIKWNDIQIYIEAFSHGSSFLNQKTQKNYQRLEFLGDAVLDSEISCYLYNKFPEAREGELTKIRAKMIQEKTLAKVSENLGINNYIILGKNLSKENVNNKILADVFESLIGAITVDLGHNSVTKFLYDNFIKNIEEILNDLDIYDYKTELQEYIHAKNQGFLTYKILKTSSNGKDNTTNFHVGVFLSKKILGKGLSSTRKEAEQHAAKNALLKFKNSDQDLDLQNK